MKEYILIAFLYLHLLYSFVLYVLNDKIIKDIYDSNSKSSYLWDKKVRLGLLADEYMSSEDYIRCNNYIQLLINGPNIDPNAS